MSSESITNARREGRVISLPLDRWSELAERCAVGKLVESKSDVPASVPRVVADGRLVLVSMVAWGCLDSSLVRGYLLDLASTYAGPTTGVYHDAEAIEAGLRARGCHQGLIVTVGGVRMVCSERFEARPTLPSTRLDLEDAVVADRRSRDAGWRRLRASHPWPTAWYLHEGHPVAEYQNDDGVYRVLLFRVDDRIEERWIPDSWSLEPVSVDEEAIIRSRRHIAKPSPPRESQAALF